MNTEQILAVLVLERDKLNRAIEALGAPVKRRGRPKNPLAEISATPTATAAKRNGMSAARRKAQSEKMKAYWAKRRKQTAKAW